MSTKNIDDFFRSQLGGHETPPGDDLWARLQAGPGAAADAPAPSADTSEQVDQLFRQRLHAHPTPPSRELWERLEDEHLRPRKRRAAAWWPMALAAAVALLLLAGGAGLWRGFPSGNGAGPAGTVASHTSNGSSQTNPTQLPAATHAPAPAAHPALAASAAPETAANGTAATAGTIAAARPTGPGAAANATSEFSQKNLPARATRPAGPASSASKVGMMAQQSPRRPRGASRQPDAAAAPAPLVARTTAPLTTPARPRTAADEPTPVVATTTPVAPAPEIVRPENAAPAALAANSVISVDVRAGAPKRPSLATAVATAAATVTEERRGLGGRLLRQVGHAVRGEGFSLSAVAGLPENLTVEANIAGRHIQL